MYLYGFKMPILLSSVITPILTCSRGKSRQPPPLTTVGQSSAHSPKSSFSLLHSFCKNFQATTGNWNLIMCRKAEKSLTRVGKAPFSPFLGQERVFQGRFIACCPSVEIYALCRKLWPTSSGPVYFVCLGWLVNYLLELRATSLHISGRVCVAHS